MGAALKILFYWLIQGNLESRGLSKEKREGEAWDLAKGIDKTDFALEYAILDTDWTTPRYIEEGLRWLAGNGSCTADCGGKGRSCIGG